LAHEAGPSTGSRDSVTLGIGVMARAPSSGGKSRLAPHLSETRLRGLRAALLADTLRTVMRGDGSRQPPSPPATSVPPGRDGGGGASEAIVFVTPADACGEVAGLSESALVCVPQAEGDLGSRMCAAFTHLLQTLKYDAAILVGSDIPLLTTGHLDDARETLAATRGVVLGPADDGGYYLIGMRTVHAELFDGVEWGTAGVLTDTLRAADRAGIEARLIRAAYDVDTVEDLHRLERDLQAAPPDLAPHMRAWFRGEGPG
jgi:rSAM/selenodomain-associated transferase 1